MVAVVGACGHAPSPSHASAAAPAVELGSLKGTWVVSAHVLATGAPISEKDATTFHQRTLDVTATGFATPWQQPCQQASRDRRLRPLDEVLSELALSPPAREAARRFGLGAQLFEYRLSCTDHGHPPPMIIYLSGDDRAMSCFGGACYLLSRF